MHTVLANDVFVFDAMGLVVVRTGSPSARDGSTVTLLANGHRLHATAVGIGSHRGRGTMLLRPRGDFGRALAILGRMLEAERIELHAARAVPTSTTMKSFVVDTLH